MTTIGRISQVVGANVRMMRKARGWGMQSTVDMLADVGHSLHFGSLQRLEVGRRRADVEDLVAFASLFNVAVEDLLAPLNPIYGRLPGTYVTPLDEDDEEEL